MTSSSTPLSSASSNITTASTEVPTGDFKQPPTTGRPPNPTGDPKQPFTPGQSAGIAIGVIILALIAAAIGFFLFRRLKQSPYRWNGGGVAKPGPPTAPAEKVVASGWHEPPKDDDSMLRIFRGIDGRITDHVLNFYVASSEAGGSGGGDLATMSKGDRHALEMWVSKLGYLVSAEKSRVFTLRAVLSSLLLSRVDEGAFFTERIGGRLTSNGTGMLSSSRINTHRDGSDIICSDTGEGQYIDARERTVLRLSQVAHEQLRTFATSESSDEARLQGMESVVRAIAEFASVVERQPVGFQLVWKAPGAKSLLGGAFAPEFMDSALRMGRDRHETKVRGVVFPGLSKVARSNDVLLAKIQVLLY